MKLFLKILPTLLSLSGLMFPKVSLAQTPISCNSIQFQECSRTLTEEQWNAIATRYYQSRYRVEFKPDNHLMSLWDVRDLLGFSGVRMHTEKNSPYQYRLWRDRNYPHKKIQAIFIFNRLVSLKGQGFDSVDLNQLKMKFFNEARRQREARSN